MTIDQFKNFATAATRPNGTGEDTVAHITGANDNRRIRGHVWQRLGTRTDDFKNQNIIARQAFVDAMKMKFSVSRLQDIPRAVLEKLELDDFDLDAEGRVRSDKPLTARRILAVTRVVDRLGTLEDRVRTFHAIAREAITPKCRKELVAMALDGSLASAEKLEEFLVRHFGGSVGKRLTEVMVQSGSDRQALFLAITKDLIAAVHADMVKAGVTRAQLEPVRRALFDLARTMQNGDRSLYRELTLTLASGLGNAAKEIARDSLVDRIAARMEKVEAVKSREMRGRSSKKIKSEHGRDVILRVALDGMSKFGRLSEAKLSTLKDILLFMARHTGEMGRERTFIWLRWFNAEFQGMAGGVNRMMVRQVLGEVLKGYTDLTDADLKQITTNQLFSFALAAADDALVNDRKPLTAYIHRQAEEAIRQNYTDAETREMMEFAQDAANAEVPPAAQPEPPAVPQVQDPERVRIVAENKIMCDNISILGKLLHREDVWTMDAKGAVESVRNTLTENPELVRSLVENWMKPGTSMSLISGATVLVMKKFLLGDRVGNEDFSSSINTINRAILDFAQAETNEARTAACTTIATQLDRLADGLMAQTQRLLNENLQQAMSGMGFGGNFKDLPQGENPEQADLLALAKSRFPVPRNETKTQRRERESKIMAEYAKLVVDPQAGGLGTLLTSLTSNYMAKLDVREQRAMISGGLLAITPEVLTEALNGHSLFKLYNQAAPRLIVGANVNEVFAEVLPQGDGQLTEGMKRMLGAVTGGILKGAGPVLQKMVQMLGVQNMPPYLQDAIRACKSDLKPIPAAYVQAKLDEVVRRSNGKIRALTNPRSIGAASIAQAFICTMTDNEGHTREVVVKMLRPDVRGRMEREIAAIKASVAGAGEGALRTLNARISSLLAELDFTEERANIDACQDVYGNSPYRTLLCVKKAEDCPELPDVLVMERAEGQTFQRYMDSTTARLNTLLNNRVNKDDHGHYAFTALAPDEKAGLERELKAMYDDVRKRQANLQRLVEVWFSNAIFGDGKFHGDLHGGNIMVDAEGKLTVIDFGNAPTFSSHDRKYVTNLVISTFRRKSTKVLDAVKELLSPSGQITLEAHREELRARFRQMFASSSYNDGFSNLTSIFGELARVGIEVPESLYNFTEAFGRLQQLSASMEAALVRISSVLPYMRSHNTIRTDAISFVGPDVSNTAEKLSRSCDELINDLFADEIKRMRLDTPGISDAKIFSTLTETIRSGEFNRLYDSLSEKNPVSNTILHLVRKTTMVDQLLAINDLAAHMDDPGTPDRLCTIIKNNLTTTFTPYLTLVPGMDGLLEQMKDILGRVFAPHGDNYNEYLYCLSHVGFAPMDENLTPEARRTIRQRSYDQALSSGLSEAVAAELADAKERFFNLLAEEVLPRIARLFKDKTAEVAKGFDLSGFAAPVALTQSLINSALSHVIGAVTLGGFNAVAFGIGYGLHKATDRTITIQGNFNVPLSDFRNYAREPEGRVHSTRARRMELVNFKMAPSVHNAEARRALVESLIAARRVTEEQFYASATGRKIASLLGLDEGETMNNVEKAGPLTTELLRKVFAVEDMEGYDQSPIVLNAMCTLFEHQTVEEVTYDVIRPKIDAAFQSVLGHNNVAEALGVDGETFNRFLRVNYGKVLKLMSEIGAADPYYAATGNAPTAVQVQRWLVAAIVGAVADDYDLGRRDMKLVDVLGAPDMPVARLIRENRFSRESPIATALLLHGLEGDNGGVDLLNFVKGLSDRPNNLRQGPDEAAQEVNDNIRSALISANSSPERAILADKARALGYGMPAIASDDTLYARFRSNPNDAELISEVKALVRKTIYRNNTKPVLNAEEESRKILGYWDVKLQLERPAVAEQEVPEAEEEPGFNLGGIFKGFMDLFAG